MSVPAKGRKAAAGETHPIRVLLVDDHVMVRFALLAVLSKETDIVVLGEAEDADGAVRLTRELQPDIVILDIEIPGQEGLQAIGEILEACRTSKVLVLTVHDDPRILQRAIGAGALGYVVKAAAEEMLVSTIRILQEGGTFFNVSPTGGVDDKRTGHFFDYVYPELDPREREALYRAAAGWTNQQIADRFGLSIKTVAGLRSRVKEMPGWRWNGKVFYNDN